MELSGLIAKCAQLFELAGVGAMVVGALVALVMAVWPRHRESGANAFRHFREKMGRSILLGLELLVAADIIRTVSEEPTLQGVLVLGAIVIIRTFLSFTLAVELEGHWPWERARLRGLKQGQMKPPEQHPGDESQGPVQQPLEH